MIEDQPELKALGGKHNLMQISATRNVTYGKLWRAFRGNATKSTRRPVGQRLDKAQALALKQFLDHIDSIRFRIRREMVRDAANSILARNHTVLYNNNEAPPRVGIHWPIRYLENTSYNKTKAKPIETSRKRAQDPAYIQTWFEGQAAYCK
ncbi:uncharacterized protein BDZ99DRAFT_72805 [Mytilinidion resinicola]|uniref:HTH CENPB-type domain-containing protein n=1 Tax=Mytilinidion resinicola TaxID=574789 RepID=A0A6A6YHM3_9PEZI|nr:uncharacterized protein BDZ99DRAFT_72805 [Mytilinidion resinicola]KAF2808089.1 hypothetical protein BDZ99DRAFT_72805 [Mytilinidion resinicola]